MPDNRTDILVVGTGLCGLAIATAAARRGHRVRCVGNGRPGSSLANFGQLHSGAVYAPVLPQVARACRQYRDRWRDLARPATVGEPYGHALFATADRVDEYREAWQSIGIDVEEIDPTASAVATPALPAAAFRIPDFSVDLRILHARTTELALASGVHLVDDTVTLHRDADDAVVAVSTSDLLSDVVVLAAGADTPALLTQAGVEHTLGTRRIAWGRYAGPRPDCLTYSLDGDLLAISPDSDGARIGLPGVNGQYGTTDVEHRRLSAALEQRRLAPQGHDLRLHWGTVCEPAHDKADPSGLVVDLRDPPAGWRRTANLIVAVPGKWTTAWHCADEVIDALG